MRPRSGWAGTLAKTGSITSSDGAAGDWFGWSVAVSGDTIVAGAPLHDVGKHVNQGAVYVFLRPRSGWAGARTETARLTTDHGAAHDLLGSTVAVSGKAIVASAPEHRVGKHPFQGELFVFVMPRSGWATTRSETGGLIASDGLGGVQGPGEIGGDELGNFSLAISGGTIVASSPGRTVGGNLEQGEAYVFVRPASGWVGTHTEAAKLFASNGAVGDLFGMSVAASGTTVVIGAPNHLSIDHYRRPGRGAAYVFLR